MGLDKETEALYREKVQAVLESDSLTQWEEYEKRILTDVRIISPKNNKDRKSALYMNKRFLFVSSVLFICFGLILIVYFSLYHPFHVEESYIRIEPVQSAEELVSIKDYIDRNADNGSYQVFCDTSEFPSESYRDYCYILIHFALKNHSPFKTAVNDGYITDMKLASFILFKRPIAFKTVLNSFENIMSEDCYAFLCYRGGLSDEELIERVRKLKVNMLYETSVFNSLNYNYDLSKALFISSFDEFDKIRNEINSKK